MNDEVGDLKREVRKRIRALEERNKNIEQRLRAELKGEMTKFREEFIGIHGNFPSAFREAVKKLETNLDNRILDVIRVAVSKDIKPYQAPK